MALATLSIDLEARLAKMEQGFDKANRLSEKFAADQAKRFSSIKSSAAAIGVALAGAFSVTQIATFVRATIDGIDALNDLKDATGSTIENISALEDAGARTGTQFESVSAILIKFNKILSDAKPGSEAANTIKLLGLNAEELKRIDPAEALRLTAVQLAKFADDGNKARVIQELFGKSVAEAAPFLKDLAEQGQLNATVTTAQAQAAEDFNKQLSSLQKNATDAARSVAGELVPALNKFIDDTKKAEGGLERLLVFLKSLGFGSGLKAFGIDLFGKDQEDVLANLNQGLAATNKLLDGGNLSEERRLRLMERRKTLEADIARLTVPQASYSNEGRTRMAPSVGGLPGADDKTKAKVSELQKYIEMLEKAQLATLDLSTEEAARIAITNGELGKLTAAQENYVLQLARGVDLSKQKSEQFANDTSALDELIERQRELSSLLANTPTEKQQQLLKLEQALTEAFKNGTHGFDGSAEAARRYHEALEALSPEMDKLADESNKFFEQAAANIQDAFGSTLKNALKGDFDSIEDLWKNLLIDMAAEAAAAQLNKYLFGDMGGSGGANWGGLIGSLLGASTGTTSGPTITGGSTGGYVIPTVGKSSGNFLSSASKSVVVDMRGQVVNVQGNGMSRTEVEAALRASNAETKASIQRSLRQGGY